LLLFFTTRVIDLEARRERHAGGSPPAVPPIARLRHVDRLARGLLPFAFSMSASAGVHERVVEVEIDLRVVHSIRQTWNFDDHVGSLNDGIALLTASALAWAVDVPQAALATAPW
jgi:hypothetical protein